MFSLNKRKLSAFSEIPGKTVSSSKADSSQLAESEACKKRGDGYFGEGKLEDAIACYRQAIAINPDFVRAYNNLSNALREQKLFREAEDCLNRAILIDPKMVYSYYNLASLQHEEGRLLEALQNFNKAIEINPDFSEAHTFKGIVLDKLGKTSDSGAGNAAPRTGVTPIGDGDSITSHAIGKSESLKNQGDVCWDNGKLEEAAGYYQQAISCNPDYSEAYARLGFISRLQGNLKEAVALFRKAALIDPNVAEAHLYLATALMDMGQNAEAEPSFRRTLELNPDSAEAHNALGILQRKSGRRPEAEANYRRALTLNPDFVVAHNNLGNLLLEMGRLPEAEASYRRALELKPDYAEAHFNLGNLLEENHRLPDAEASFRRAIDIKPDFVEAHYNLGIALYDLGRLDEAEASFRKVLQFKPDYTLALDSLASLLNERGDSKMALSTIRQSLRIEETAVAKDIFVSCMHRLRFNQVDSETQDALVRALTEPWGNPGKLARISNDLLRHQPDIAEYIARASKAWPGRLSTQDLFGTSGINTIAGNELLCAMLDSTFICDIEMEQFLTMVRYAMLNAATEAKTADAENAAVLRFCSSLARQCFINEYIFSCTNDEIRQASKLRDALGAALEAKAPVPALWPLVVATYFPLNSIPFAGRLLNDQWPDVVSNVLQQQVLEPAEEMRLRATIPRLTGIEDGISIKVQGQYEENPYPRWVKIASYDNAMNPIEYLRRKFPLASIKGDRGHGGFDVLIAGCGTGRQSIEAAQKFQYGQMLAVDLSISSLAYAKRRSREMGFVKIEYAQSDLLKLGSIGRSFDVIESVGVLHHLQDPWAGWKVLLSLLRPGGFMMLGFYSKVARREIVEARAIIAKHDSGITADEIRQSRQDFLNLRQLSNFGTILNTSDFYNLSACRDLLFHVQEHQMTLSGIDVFLKENNLAFLGFEMESNILHAYKRRFPQDHAATDLGQWQTFEHENPNTFFGMYQFWVQKLN
jgi:tetratricopeptide (TPR) repeat protein/SAM-dependent methyltransferase